MSRAFINKMQKYILDSLEKIASYKSIPIIRDSYVSSTIMLSNIYETQQEYATNKDWDGFSQYLISISIPSIYNHFSRQFLNFNRFRDAPAHIHLKMLETCPVLLNECYNHFILREIVQSREYEYKKVFSEAFITKLFNDESIASVDLIAYQKME